MREAFGAQGLPCSESARAAFSSDAGHRQAFCDEHDRTVAAKSAERPASSLPSPNQTHLDAVSVPRAISAWRGGRGPPFHRGNQRRLRQLASCRRHPLRLSSVEPLSPSLDAPRARRGALRFGLTFCAARGGRPAPSGPAVSAFECRAAVLIGSSCKLGGAPRCPTQTEERRSPISLRTYRSGARRRSVGQ